MYTMRFVFTLVSLIACLATASSAAAQNATPIAAGQGTGEGAPFYRGNAARTGATADHGPTGPVAVAWTARMGGGQAPAVVDGVVYVSGSAGNLSAFDAATGEELWSTRHQGSASAPAVADGFVVVGGGEGLFAFDAATGEQRWHYVPNPEPVGELPPGIVDSSPVIVDGIIYVGDGPIGGLFAVDLATGELRWRFETEGGSPSSPAVVDGVVYIASDPQPYGETQDWTANVYAVDADTGSEIWRFAVEGEAASFTTSPAVVDGVVYATSMDVTIGAPSNAVLHALEAMSGEELWQAEAGGGEVGAYLSASVDDGRVIVGTGSDNALVALDAKTGEELWRHPAGSIVESPVIAGGVVYASDLAGTLSAVDASTGEERWTFSVNGFTTSPTVAGGMVYIQNWDDGLLYAIGDAPAGATPVA